MGRDLPSNLGEWIRQTQAHRSEEAGRKLFEFCRENLLPVIKRTMREEPYLASQPEDFLNETCRVILCAHFAEDVLKSPTRTLGYLEKIAENVVRVAARHHCGFRRHCLHETPLPDPERLLSHEPSPEEALRRKEEESRFEIVLGQLPEVDRRTVELRRDGIKPPEIARRLGVRQSASTKCYCG
jgi:RNA polymerase sigma factor (sigma-70 family)